MYLYNKIVDIVTERKIIQKMNCYLRIRTWDSWIKKCKVYQVNYFPWNEENEADEMIKIWREFTESKKFECNNVRLI